MAPVEIIAIKGSLILRARGSELLILPNHVAELKQCKEPKPLVNCTYYLEIIFIVKTI